MTNFTPEMIQKAKAAKSAEELLAIAKENSVEMTEEEAEMYFEQLNSAVGELSDDELDNIAGGITEKWYYTFNPSRGEPNYTMYNTMDTVPTPVVVIGNVERLCRHCRKVTVFSIPEQGPDYCSVCNNVYDGPVID